MKNLVFAPQYLGVRFTGIIALDVRFIVKTQPKNGRMLIDLCRPVT